MLRNLSEQVRECLRHAEECAQQANLQLDPKLAGDYLDLERRWLRLARSYQLGSNSNLSQAIQHRSDRTAYRRIEQTLHLRALS
jgi:hypothetical protein